MENSLVTGPLRIRTEGRYNGRPDFVVITHALLGRIFLLAAVYGGGNGDAGRMWTLLAQAERGGDGAGGFSAVPDSTEMPKFAGARAEEGFRRKVNAHLQLSAAEARARGPMGRWLLVFQWGVIQRPDKSATREVVGSS